MIYTPKKVLNKPKKQKHKKKPFFLQNKKQKKFHFDGKNNCQSFVVCKKMKGEKLKFFEVMT